MNAEDDDYYPQMSCKNLDLCFNLILRYDTWDSQKEEQ